MEAKHFHPEPLLLWLRGLLVQRLRVLLACCCLLKVLLACCQKEWTPLLWAKEAEEASTKASLLVQGCANSTSTTLPNLHDCCPYHLMQFQLQQGQPLPQLLQQCPLLASHAVAEKL
jgi:hypothetical protein